MHRSGIVKGCDSRVLQFSEQFYFASKAFAPRRRKSSVQQELDRNLIARIFSFGKIDGSHAAFTDEAEKTIASYFLKFNSIVRVCDHRVCDVR